MTCFSCQKRKAKFIMESNIAGDVAHAGVNLVDEKAKAALDALSALEDLAVAAGQSGITVIDKTADNLIEEAQVLRASVAELAHRLADIVGKKEVAV